MPLDPLIASGGTPIQIDNPVNKMAALLQAQGYQQANEMNGMKMQQQRMANDRQSKLYSALQALGPNATTEQHIGTLRGLGEYDMADKVLTGEGARAKTAAEVGKTGQETIGLALTNTSKFVPGIQSADGAATYLRGLYSDPVLGPAVARLKPLEQAIKEIPQDPQGLEQWKMAHGNMSPEKFIELTTAKPTEINNGQQKSFRDLNPRSPTYGQDTGGAAVQLQATPDAVLSSDTSIKNNRNTVAASLENAGATREVASATRDAARIQTGFANEQGLRKEFEGLPEVKNYKQAYPAYAAIKDAAGRNTTQSDINIVYGLAKLYDPTSVVREGEYATVANSPNIPEKVKGYAQYLAGGGRLSPETKKQILAEAEGRIGTYSAEAKKAKGSYEGIAKKRGMDPASVFADMGDMTSNQQPAPAGRTVVKTGTLNGKKVVKYSDGTVDYAN